MADRFSSNIRSQIMARIKSKNTKIEILIRKALFRFGFRYRIHVRNIAGKPDLVFKKYNALVFVHGCFWHGHDCSLFRLPKSNVEFWENKIKKNKENDARNEQVNLTKGFRTLIVWECAVRGKDFDATHAVIRKIQNWLLSNDQKLEIRGN